MRIRYEESIRTECCRHCRSLPRRRARASRSILEHYLSVIAAQNETLHAFVEVFEEPARQRADALDRIASISGPVGPLHGVPIAVKDLACIEGRAPGFGSKCYRGTPAGPTAPAIQRLIDAGAIIIGMTIWLSLLPVDGARIMPLAHPGTRSTGLFTASGGVEQRISRCCSRRARTGGDWLGYGRIDPDSSFALRSGGLQTELRGGSPCGDCPTEPHLRHPWANHANCW